MPFIDQIKVGSTTRDIQDSGARANEGTLANLTTTEKGSLVGAINEVNAEIKATEIVVQSESQPIVQIADGSANNAKSYDVQITPQQDLHGYENPWPAGGGKNILNIQNQTTTLNGVTFTVNSDGTVTVTTAAGGATADTDFLLLSNADALALLTVGENYVFSGCPSGGSQSTYCMRLNVRGWFDTGAGIVVSNFDGNSIGNFSIRISSGYSISGSLVFKPMIEKGTTKTSWTPYSNICPISGWTGAEVVAAGKNLYAGTNAASTIYYNIIYGGRDEDTLLIEEDWALKPGTYTISFGYENMTATPSMFVAYKVHGDWVFIGKGQVNSFSFTLPEDYTRLNIWGYAGTYTGFKDVQIEQGSVATEYEPFAGSINSISFPASAGTVYGGSLHVNEDGSGTLVVDWEKSAIPESNPTIIDHNYYGAADCGWSLSRKKYGKMNVISDTFMTISTPSARPYCITGRDNNQYVTFGVPIDIATSAEAAGNWIRSLITHIWYELATPQTYTLTAPQIALLLGENNLWADTGDMAVEYIADTKLYIQTLTGHPDEGMIAGSNIPSGQFFMVGNRLFISTSAIASGETIVPGTNCTETNLAAALNTINAE